jgi:hypothetical protein
MFAFPSILLYPLEDGDPDDDRREPGLSVSVNIESVQCHFLKYRVVD